MRLRTRRRNLRALDINAQDARRWASSRKGYWWTAGSWVLCYALPNAYWTNLGLQGFADRTAVSGTLSEPPDADPHVRWCGRGQGKPGPYPILCGGLSESVRAKGSPYRDPAPTQSNEPSTGLEKAAAEAATAGNQEPPWAVFGGRKGLSL